MKTFSQIKIGDHLSNKCFDLMVTSVTAKFINGYHLETFRFNGKIETQSIHIEQFDNKYIIADLKVARPVSNTATIEQLNHFAPMLSVDVSSIEIY